MSAISGGLVGRLLVRKLLKDRGVQLQDMTFGTTSARKPYIASRLAYDCSAR